jgi:hypothetical protein
VDRWNFPTGVDARWIREGGGIVGRNHPPARRFNAGQKVIYWVVVLGGGTAAVTGYLLMFPFYATDIGGMQTAQMVHAIVGVVFIAIMLAHIYIGTIGMQGAFEAMGKGDVDVNWARQHHSLWLDREVQKGHVKMAVCPGGINIAGAESVNSPRSTAGTLQLSPRSHSKSARALLEARRNWNEEVVSCRTGCWLCRSRSCCSDGLVLPSPRVLPTRKLHKI